MLNKFLPKKEVKRFTDVTAEFLKSKGKKGVIVDLDNTLIPWNQAHATAEIKAWFQSLADANIAVLVFSNNNAERVSIFAKPLGVNYVSMAKKPLRGGFSRAKKQLNLADEEIVVIGDQLLTDILGGNRSNLYTILVDPILKSDAPITMFNRRLEKMILNHFYRKGKLTRRDTDGR